MYRRLMNFFKTTQPTPMKVSPFGLELIKKFEKLAKLLPNGTVTSYPDPGTKAEPYTIGYGMTYYPDGRKVNKGDVILKCEAEDYFVQIVERDFAQAVRDSVLKPLTQNQFDALVSLAFNIGVGALKKSTLLKKININPGDLTISGEFAKWNKAAGKVLKGLTIRRKQESDLYFS